MSTGNFYRGNANYIYAFGSAKYYTEEDVKELELDESMIGEYDECMTEADYRYHRDYCCELLREYGYTETDGWDNNRGYELHYLMSKDEYLSFHGVEYRITFKAGCRSGYYEGANFDYDIEIEEYCNDYYNACYDEMPSFSDILNAFESRNGRPRRRTYDKEHSLARQMERKLESLLDDMIEEVEEVFKETCEMKLVVSARFGNGETWYSKAE